MNIKCCICHELFVPSDDVYFTPCGHFFHFPCVSHWLERSKSCPHCRTKVTERSIHRAYFDFSNADDIEVNTTVLTSKIDSLKFQILLKDKDLKTCGEENTTLKAQTAGLRAEVRKLEAEINEHRSAIYALKKQSKYMKDAATDCEEAKKEILRLKKSVIEFRNVQTLINDSQDEVDKMLAEAQDKAALITYVSVMKRELESNVLRRKELRDKIRKLEREKARATSERDNLLQQVAKYRQLEEDMAHCESEKQSLWNKLQELKSQRSSARTTSSEDIQRFIAESPAPARTRTLREYENRDILDCNTTCSDTTLDSKPETDSQELPPELKSNEKSSNPLIKAQGARDSSTLSQRGARLRPSSSSLSILSKKPRLAGPLKAGQERRETYYDGFGGHSKVDDYPSPIRIKSKVLKNNLMSMKVKRRKLPDCGVKKLDDFLIDLT